MNEYWIANMLTGEVTRKVYTDCPSEQLLENEIFIICDAEAANLQEWQVYFDLEYEVTKPRKAYNLDNLPLPCTITIEGVSYEVTEQPTFEFDVAGEYIIEVDAGVRYLKKEFKYVVEA